MRMNRLSAIYNLRFLNKIFLFFSVSVHKYVAPQRESMLSIDINRSNIHLLQKNFLFFYIFSLEKIEQPSKQLIFKLSSYLSINLIIK